MVQHRMLGDWKFLPRNLTKVGVLDVLAARTEIKKLKNIPRVEIYSILHIELH